MDRFWIAPCVVAGASLAAPALARPQGLPETPAALVAASVEIDGRPAPLYPAPDGSGRYYVEARRGGRYAVTFANRTSERLGVVLTVDGLNAISGERDAGRGRMYVLDPWQRTTVRGWRTSLREVRQFTFVDEQESYAARSAKANEKMGWIEIAVHRERRPFVQSLSRPEAPSRPRPVEREGDDARTKDAAEPARDAAGAAAPAFGGAPARAYPGTGWGEPAHDPVVLVSFDPETDPSERIALRYEYRPALVALGVLPRRVPPRDRLWQRDHAEPGFAPPPVW
ncbi:MAG TPA: hypothetical protein VL691_04690 [Vicinamibacteria bacterium]|nr:hypothetical protein [Vicinamibacteria bacterium]